MTTKQHILFILCCIIAGFLYPPTISIGMLYFFALVNGQIPWKKPHSDS